MREEIKFNAQNLLSDSDMVLLSLSELGCYIRLKSHYWLTGELPSETLSLAKLAGCTIGQFQNVWPKVGQHFEKTDNGTLFCPDLDSARKKVAKTSERMSKVANARWKRVLEGKGRLHE